MPGVKKKKKSAFKVKQNKNIIKEMLIIYNCKNKIT